MLAAALGQSAGQVTRALPRYPQPATNFSIEFGPGISAVNQSESTAALTELLHLFPPSRMNGLEVYVATDPAWIDERVATSTRISVFEQQEFLAGGPLRDLGDSYTYSLRGPNDEQTVVFLASPWYLEESRIAHGVVREVSINFFSIEGTGIAGDPWPCWAAEGLGYPLAWEAISRALGGSYSDWRDPWVAQLRRATDVRLGLAASELRSGTPQHPCFLNPGVGHIQGAMFGELLLPEAGLDGILSWAKASRGRSWRDALVAVYNGTAESWYQRFDDVALAELR